ncbi:MAG: redox-sensitive bicupin YhaK (pirin superfamily) [Roseivirga sp.]|jgi:redox-sensitive bicupin YhaK (pirin superfamily)
MNNSIISIHPLSFPWQTNDPFLFCAFHKDNYPQGNGQLGPNAKLKGRNLGADFSGKDGWSMYHGQSIPGFPAHPHRGFETVTIAEQGLVDHSDSLGAAGRFGDGDVQWMTAGKGVQHSEMFPLLKENEPNPLVLFQIWLNLPGKSKMVEPHFAMLWNEEIPIVENRDEEGYITKIKIITGTLSGYQAPAPAPDSWAADPHNVVAIWIIEIEPRATWKMPIASKGVNRSLYFYEGSKLSIDAQAVDVNSVIELKNQEVTTLKNGDTKAKLLFLQGRPINEPVAQYGPFVMNSDNEIQEAMRAFQETQFGGWPWGDYEHTHNKEKGRFALHADGREEIMD